jgi:hypothetical protein
MLDRFEFIYCVTVRNFHVETRQWRAQRSVFGNQNSVLVFVKSWCLVIDVTNCDCYLGGA